nr:hypothetical protein [Tanacetum cinerariifolium]
MSDLWLPMRVSSANSSAGATHQLSSGYTSSLAVGKCISSGNSFALTVAKYLAWDLHNWQWNDLEHFIPNNPPLNLMLHLANSSAGATHQLSSGNTSSLAVGKCTSSENSFALTVAKYLAVRS